MTHPTDIPSFRAALGAIARDDVPEEAAEAIAAAQMVVSPVPQCGQVIDALKPHVATLALPAAQVLAGAAHLVLTNAWLGRGEEADGVRDQARARIAALE
jgi:hypothetical protein